MCYAKKRVSKNEKEIQIMRGLGKIPSMFVELGKW